MIEFIIVIAVISILGMVLIIGINPQRQFAQARNNQRVAHVNRIYGAFKEYFSRNNKYPDCLSVGDEVDIMDCNQLFDQNYLPPSGFTDPDSSCEGSGYFAKIDTETERLGVAAICTEIEEELIKAGYWNE